MDYFHAFGDAQLNLELVEKQHFFLAQLIFCFKEKFSFFAWLPTPLKDTL